MDFKQYFVAKVYRKKEPVPYQLDNGNKGVTYSLIVDNMEDTETVKVSEDVYGIVKDGTYYVFCTSINSSYQRKEVRIMDILCELPDGGISAAELQSCIVSFFNKVKTGKQEQKQKQEQEQA